VNDVTHDISWLNFTLWSNALQDYLIAIGGFFILWWLLRLACRAVKAKLKNLSTSSNILLFKPLSEIVGKLNPAFFPIIALYLTTRGLTIPQGLDKLLYLVTLLAVTIQLIILASRIISIVVEHSPFFKHRADDLAAQNTARNITTILKAAIWVAGVLFLLDNIGLDVTAFVAGLGIGGIAIALAAQAILGDTFSSFAIALDKPFEVGDFLIIGELMGNVEHVGLKTTRIRSLSGELLIFCNSDLTGSRIRNFKKMYQRRINFNLGVTYDTSLDNLKEIPNIIKDAINSTDQTRFDRAHFFQYGSHALIFDVVYFCLFPDFNIYMDIQQEINFKIHHEFTKRGIEFAFPTQTVHLKSETNTSIQPQT